MMNHPLAQYSNKNHSPIWAYTFLAGCLYAMFFRKSEKIIGGLADGLPDSYFDKRSLEKGIKVEMEHTDDAEVAKEIAKDHLFEDSEYYEKLMKLENPSRKKRFMQILKPLDELAAFAHKTMTEKKIIPEKYNYTLNSTDMFFPGIVKNVVERFHSPQQITEVLKRYRAKFFLENLVPYEFGFSEELVKNKDLLKKYNRIAKEAHWYNENLYVLGEVNNFWQSSEIKHHFDNARANEIWEILNLDLKPIKSPAELKIILGRIEGEWIEKKRLQEPSPVREGEVFIDCGDGYKWIYLDTPTCRMEAEAMAHCGNTGGSEDARILSLREFKKDKKGKIVEIPHLTFIGYEREEKFGLMSEKFYVLGEMKGYANSKPSKKYHHQIMKLILDSRILFLAGGGYKPENNFHLEDLSGKELNVVKRQKPQFFDVKLMLELGPERMNALFQIVTKSNTQFEVGEMGDFGPRTFVVGKFDNLEDLINAEYKSEWRLPRVRPRGNWRINRPLQHRPRYSRRSPQGNDTIESLFASLNNDDWLHEDYLEYGYRDDYETVRDIIRYMEKTPKGRKALKNLDKILKPYGKNYNDLPELFHNFDESGEFRDNEVDLYDAIQSAIQVSYIYPTSKYYNRLAIAAMNEEKWGAGLYLKFSDKESIWKPVSIQIDAKDLIDFCEKALTYGYEREGYPILEHGNDLDYAFSIKDPRDNLSFEYDPQDGANSLTDAYALD